METRLIVRNDTKFDKIRKRLFKSYFKKEFELIQMMDNLVLKKVEKPTNIIIPREIGKRKNEKY